MIRSTILVLISLIASSLTAAETRVESIAHRGESADAPENTLAAFRLAWERNDDAIELDVHLTKDGRLICCHDADTERTTGVKQIIKQSTLEELQQLDAGSWKNPRYAGEKLPTLEEALATIPDGKRCFIEVKIGAEAVPALVKAVRESGKKPEQLAIISFKADAVAEAKKQLPELKAFFLANFKQNEQTGQWTPTADELIAQAKTLKADGLDLGIKGPLDRDFVQRVKAAGLECYVWTVDEPEIAQRMIQAGIDGVTSNKAAWLREQLQAR